MAYSKTTTRRRGITLDQAQEHLEAWLEAEMEITTHQSYQLGSRQLTLANLEEVREQIDYWDKKVEALEDLEETGTRRAKAYRAVLRDL